MTDFMHHASGGLATQFWSVGLASSGSITEGAAETAWGNAWHAFMTDASVSALFPTTVTLTETYTTTVDGTWHQTTVTKSNWTDAGTSAGVSMPPQVAVGVTWRSAYATRYGRGRWYLPPMDGGQLAADGYWGATQMTTLATALGTLYSSLVTAGLSPLLVSRRNGLRTTAYTTRSIASADMPNKAVIQKRRGDKLVPTRTTISL